MNQITTCPEWEYKDVAGSGDVLAKRAEGILVSLHASSRSSGPAAIEDTRPLHGRYFADLTPPFLPYFAGHYRGEDFMCLRDYEVSIAMNPLVGHVAGSVPIEMREFRNELFAALSNLDFVWAVNERVVTKAMKFRRLAETIALLFAKFLEIHPYANGNGHMARFMALWIFSRYGIHPRAFPLHGRPPDPPYSLAIRAYQQGNLSPLADLLLECI